MTTANEYSSEWFSRFLDTIPPESTRSEVDGIVAHIPLPQFRLVLDVCCGPGRHMVELANRGYEVAGIDRDAAAVARARRAIPAATVRQLDMRNLDTVVGEFDVVLNLWASFGFFDPKTNDRVLSQMQRLLRPGGRLLLDIFHPGWFEKRQGQEHLDAERGTRTITENVEGNRWRVTIEYDSGGRDLFEWELFTPEELTARAAAAGLAPIALMSWWDETRRPSPQEARYQAVFERL